MPKFLIRRVFEFAPGTVDGREETPPGDLLDASGRLILPVAWWPAEPFAIESGDEGGAIKWAEREWIRQERMVCLDQRVTAARFVELQDRPRPGAPNQEYVSMVGFWAVKEEAGLWHPAV